MSWKIKSVSWQERTAIYNKQLILAIGQGPKGDLIHVVPGHETLIDRRSRSRSFPTNVPYKKGGEFVGRTVFEGARQVVPGFHNPERKAAPRCRVPGVAAAGGAGHRRPWMMRARVKVSFTTRTFLKTLRLLTQVHPTFSSPFLKDASTQV